MRDERFNQENNENMNNEIEYDNTQMTNSVTQNIEQNTIFSSYQVEDDGTTIFSAED